MTGWFENGSTPREIGSVMLVLCFSTATPEPRAEGSSPSAPAKESRRSNRFFGFLLWAKMALNCGTRSVRRGAGRQWRPFSADRAGRRDKSLLLQNRSTFRFCFVPLLTFSSGTSSKEHQFGGCGFCVWYAQRLKSSVIPFNLAVSFLT